MREGGLDAQFFSIWVEPEFYGTGGERAVARADEQIEAVRALAENTPRFGRSPRRPPTSAARTTRGKLAALLGLEGGYAIDEKLERVEHYFRRGVRYMTPAWTHSSELGRLVGRRAGATRGLNDFGREVIREMNRLGMMVDVSHVSDKTFWDIVETSTTPVVATHSNCRALADVPRNLTDDMIRAIAKTGGVVSVVFYPGFLEPGWRERRTRSKPRFSRSSTRRAARRRAAARSDASPPTACASASTPRASRPSPSRASPTTSTTSSASSASSTSASAPTSTASRPRPPDSLRSPSCRT